MKRELVDYARETHKLSLTAACEMLGISRSVYRYRPQPNNDLSVVEAIQQVIEETPASGSQRRSRPYGDVATLGTTSGYTAFTAC